MLKFHFTSNENELDLTFLMKKHSSNLMLKKQNPMLGSSHEISNT